jgi:hypothetical protein
LLYQEDIWARWLLAKNTVEKKDKKKEKDEKPLRQSWIPRSTGFTAITVVSVTLAIWVAWQSVSGGGTLWNGILWGVVMGASIWLVFLGMNYFHSFFGKPDNYKKGKKNS